MCEKIYTLEEIPNRICSGERFLNYTDSIMNAAQMSAHAKYAAYRDGSMNPRGLDMTILCDLLHRTFGYETVKIMIDLHTQEEIAYNAMVADSADKGFSH